jgi:hypothetical protein
MRFRHRRYDESRTCVVISELVESGRQEVKALGQDKRGKILAAVSIPWAFLLGSRMVFAHATLSRRAETGLMLSVVVCEYHL